MEKATATTETGIASRRVRYTTRIEQVKELEPAERERLRAVAGRYAFRVNDYYAGLIDWSDPNDPIRQLVIPREEELHEYGQLDASDEESSTVALGVQHKYADTALLLCNEVCGAYCRYCFRKRLFMNDNDEVTNDVSNGIAYIAAHPEISNVLLTGGDPLLMSTRRIREIVESLRGIEHVRIIRIGSKIPAFNPWRILDDDELLAVLAQNSLADRRIYLMAHFDHPRELTSAAIASLDRYIQAGVVAVNQCPLIRGVNDNPAVLAELWEKLSFAGCQPYYLFQGRPTAGNGPYEVPITHGWSIFQEALQQGSGLARQPRFVMSHALGKIEILAVDTEQIYLRVHRAKDPADLGRLILAPRDDRAGWLDELDWTDWTRPADQRRDSSVGAVTTSSASG